MAHESIYDINSKEDRSNYAEKVLNTKLDLMKAYSNRIFILIICYFSSSFLLILLHHILSISDKVIISFIASTSASVVGLLAIIMRYLFK